MPFWSARFSRACCVTMHAENILKAKFNWPHNFVATDPEFGIVDIT